MVVLVGRVTSSRELIIVSRLLGRKTETVSNGNNGCVRVPLIGMGAGGATSSEVGHIERDAA